jgi:hypothetical protein
MNSRVTTVMEPFRDFLPVISALTALVAVVVSPFVTWKIAKRQINASNVSSKRQVWIDELRKDIAQALAVVSHIEGLRRPDHDLNRDEQLQVFDERARAEVLAMELLMRIRLRMNPNEQEHNELNSAFERLSQASPDPQPGETAEQIKNLQVTFFAAREDVLVITQTILKKEWDRVRQGG